MVQVLRLAKMAIEACVRRNKYIGICGQAPSDYPEITAWLVKNGCASMALQPDVVLPMTRLVMEVEAELKAFRDDAKEHVSFEL
jgi:pyruvate,water dikinase